jgi:hypothetical protein
MSTSMVEMLLIGFSDSSARTLSIALQNRAKNICQLSDDENANVALVDIDNDSNESQWSVLANQRGIPLIAVSADEKLPSRYREYFNGQLQKPLNFSKMLETVCRASGRGLEGMDALQHATSATTAIFDTQIINAKPGSTHAKHEGNVIDTRKFLLGLMVDALSSDKGDHLMVRWSDDQFMIMDKSANRAYFRIKPLVYRHFAILPLDKLDVKTEWISKQQADEMSAQNIWHEELESVIWSLNLRTLDTKQPKHLNLNTAYQLSSWPNLTRCTTGEMDAIMSNYWVDNPSSIHDTAKNLSLPFETVMPFASCCHAVGLLTAAESSTSANTGKESKDKGIRKVMSMILGKLKG